MKQYNRYKASAQSKLKVEKANKHINFVVIAYVIILLYLIFIIYLSFTKIKINYFYAEPGQIHNEGIFEGLILRNETVVYSNESGPVKYFIPEGNKVRQNAFVCSVNQDGELDKIINEQINTHLSQLNTAMSLTLDDHNILQGKIKEYVMEKPFNDLTYTYSAKDLIQGTLIDLSKTVYIKDQELFERVQESIALNEEQKLTNGTFYRMPEGGVVGYTFDGFEKYSVDNFEVNLLKKDIDIKDVSQTSDTIASDPLFKVMNNYLIYMATEITPYCMKYLENKDYITLYFPKKNLEFVVKVNSLDTVDNKYYATFEIDRFIDSFFNDRFVDFKIIYEDYTGLKVPNESILTKELFQVPKSAIYEEKGSYKIQKQIYSNNDATHSELQPITVKVYYEDNDYAYIDSMSKDVTLNIGDVVLYVVDEDARVSETENYTLAPRLAVEGVYVLNKGYTDFKRIQTVYEGDSFRIIQQNLGYSVGIFDKVVTDATGMTEFTTIN